jgi:hypothetical protein
MSDLAPDSRYKIALVEQNDECQMVVVGWDAPLCTFFFQVWEEDDETDEEPLVWGGYELGEMRVLEELQERVGRHSSRNSREAERGFRPSLGSFSAPAGGQEILGGLGGLLTSGPAP